MNKRQYKKYMKKLRKNSFACHAMEALRGVRADVMRALQERDQGEDSGKQNMRENKRSV